MKRLTKEELDAMSADEKMAYATHLLHRVEVTAETLLTAQHNWFKMHRARRRFVISLCVFFFAIGILAGQIVERYL